MSDGKIFLFQCVKRMTNSWNTVSCQNCNTYFAQFYSLLIQNGSEHILEKPLKAYHRLWCQQFHESFRNYHEMDRKLIRLVKTADGFITNTHRACVRNTACKVLLNKWNCGVMNDRPNTKSDTKNNFLWNTVTNNNRSYEQQLRPIIQGGSNMTGTNCALFTHNQSRSYLNHLVYPQLRTVKSVTIVA